MQDKRIKEIDMILEKNAFYRKLSTIMVIAFGISSARYIANAVYFNLAVDVICVIAISIYVSVIEREDKQLLEEKQKLLEDIDANKE